MSATLDVIASRVNLHKGSVSRILNGKGGAYSEETRARVLQAALEAGYQPNHVARSLATGLTQTVSLWMVAQDFYSPYFGFVQHTLYRESIKRGYQIITEELYDEAGGPDDSENPVSLWPVDGILACDVPHFAAGYRRSASRRQRPVVTLGEWCDPETDYVRLDLIAGTKEATDHLVDAGCRTIAFVTPIMGTHRSQAYTERMAAVGRESQSILVRNASRAAGYEAMRDWICAHDVPDGLLCFNDEVAIGCYTALTKAGLRIPADVRIVGCDGLENAQYLPCPISSIRLPVEEMCGLAWDILLSRLNESSRPLQQSELVPRLVVRASSAGEDSGAT